MAKIHNNVEQGTLNWLRLHIGKATASELHQLLTPQFELRTGEMPKTYLAKKVAEAWRGEPLPAFGSWQTEQGLIREEEAIPWYELEYGVELERVGFIEHDGGMCGCSPDALIGEDSGIEIKSPEAHTHVKYLLNGVLPPEYATQVHGSMYVTGRSEWRFMSYRRKFPPFIIITKRDEEIMGKIEKAIDRFTSSLRAAMETLKERASA